LQFPVRVVDKLRRGKQCINQQLTANKKIANRSYTKTCVQLLYGAFRGSLRNSLQQDDPIDAEYWNESPSQWLQSLSLRKASGFGPLRSVKPPAAGLCRKEAGLGQSIRGQFRTLRRVSRQACEFPRYAAVPNPQGTRKTPCRDTLSAFSLARTAFVGLAAFTRLLPNPQAAEPELTAIRSYSR
jgi:hypothetical protein